MNTINFHTILKEYERLAHEKARLEFLYGHQAVAELLHDLHFYDLDMTYETKWVEWERLLELIEITLESEREKTGGH
jgi:hypothetical protein